MYVPSRDLRLNLPSMSRRQLSTTLRVALIADRLSRPVACLCLFVCRFLCICRDDDADDDADYDDFGDDWASVNYAQCCINVQTGL